VSAAVRHGNGAYIEDFEAESLLEVLEAGRQPYGTPDQQETHAPVDQGVDHVPRERVTSQPSRPAAHGVQEYEARAADVDVDRGEGDHVA
jgi:hypothetical protein